MSRFASRTAASPLQRFILLAGACYLLWFVGYEHYLAADGRLDTFLTRHLASTSAAGLRLLGFTATASAGPPCLISLAGHPAVSVGHPCNGLALFALFSGFILAFPGGGRRKLWFVPLGIGVIFGLNVLRIMALVLNNYYAHSSVDFNHHYTFTVVVYASIFGLWMWWATRLAPPVPFSPAGYASS